MSANMTRRIVIVRMPKLMRQGAYGEGVTMPRRMLLCDARESARFSTLLGPADAVSACFGHVDKCINQSGLHLVSEL